MENNFKMLLYNRTLHPARGVQHLPHQAELAALLEQLLLGPLRYFAAVVQVDDLVGMLDRRQAVRYNDLRHLPMQRLDRPLDVILAYCVER